MQRTRFSDSMREPPGFARCAIALTLDESRAAGTVRPDRGRPSPSLAMVAGAIAGLSIACAPQGETGFCDADTPCPGRGQACDMVSHECFVEDFEADSTEDSPPSEFTGKIVPFFRGRVCLPEGVKSGDPIPVAMEGCFHPCLTPTEITFRHFYECIGSSCLAYSTMWMVADSAAGGCPADAFGEFDRSMCNNVSVELQISTDDGADGSNIAGSMLLEIPYLTNADMEAIVASSNDESVTREKIDQYPQQAGRIPGQKAIWVLPDLPSPPATCVGDDGCECYDIGF